MLDLVVVQVLVVVDLVVVQVLGLPLQQLQQRQARL